jgi:hypothetical protein
MDVISLMIPLLCNFSKHNARASKVWKKICFSEGVLVRVFAAHLYCKGKTIHKFSQELILMVNDIFIRITFINKKILCIF